MTGRIRLAAACLLLAAAALAGAEVEHVPAREVAAAAERLIDGAEREARVFVYLFSVSPGRPDGWPARLGRALGRARARGVDVEVTLERGVGGGVDNGGAAALLRREGVPVFYAEGATLHAKALIVDGEAVLAGSSNWTAGAFGENAEANFLIRSTAAARSLLAELGAAPRSPAPAPEAPPAVRVPAAFLTARAGAIVHNKDARAWDAYLHFLDAGVSTAAPTAADLPALCAAVGWRNVGVHRQQARELLRRLRDKYGLIDLEEAGGRAAPVIRRRDLGGGDIALPRAYFRDGWPGRLTFAGRVFYLINLHRAGLSPRPPWWSMGQARLAETYGVSVGFIQNAVTDLRRRNLVEARYGEIPPDGGPREPSAYAANPLPDPAVDAERLRALAAAFGPAALARARGWAAVVYEDGDAGAAESLLDFERRYGRATVERAARVLGGKSPGNPKRTIAYFLGTIRGMADGR